MYFCFCIGSQSAALATDQGGSHRSGLTYQAKANFKFFEVTPRCATGHHGKNWEYRQAIWLHIDNCCRLRWDGVGQYMLRASGKVCL